MTSIEWLIDQLIPEDQHEGIMDIIEDAKERHKQEMATNCSQLEISDEEIEKAAKNSAIEQFEAGNSVYTLAFQEGYKWYREQLKQRQ
jgi:hypothetical protein